LAVQKSSPFSPNASPTIFKNPNQNLFFLGALGDLAVQKSSSP
jgi:hypothetical protein